MDKSSLVVAQPPNPNVIEVQALTKRYGPRVLFDNIGFSIRAGESVALTGAIGVGKSTLLKTILGFISPDSGRVWLDPVATAERTLTIGYQPQAMALPGNLSVKRFLEFCAATSGLARDLAQARVGMAIEACGLAHITGQTCGDLPLLENHLVAVAQAGVARPDLLVLDEPAAGLGVRAAGQVIAAIQRLRNEQQTLLIAAPVTAGLDTLCDRAIALFAGRIGEIPLIETREQSERLVVSLEEIPAELRPALLDMGFEVDEDNYRISHRGTNIQIEHSLLSALLSSNVRISRWDREPVVFPSEEE